MSLLLSSFLSGLAYLAFCLLIAVFRARSLRDGVVQGVDYMPSEDGHSVRGEGASCLISLSLFLFMPCGALPSLLPVHLGALLVIFGLAVAPVFQGGWKRIRRQLSVPLCLGASLAVIARYAQERGVPGNLYALDAYVAMPIIGVAEGAEAAGFCVLATASLFVLWQAMPAQRIFAFGETPLTGEEAPLAALAAELWGLAAVAFWVCLFFPASFASGEASIAILNALFFWAKVLAVKWLLEKLREKYPRGAPFHASISLILWGIGACLLLDAAAG